MPTPRFHQSSLSPIQGHGHSQGVLFSTHVWATPIKWPGCSQVKQIGPTGPGIWAAEAGSHLGMTALFVWALLLLLQINPANDSHLAPQTSHHGTSSSGCNSFLSSLPAPRSGPRLKYGLRLAVAKVFITFTASQYPIACLKGEDRSVVLHHSACAADCVAGLSHCRQLAFKIWFME